MQEKQTIEVSAIDKRKQAHSLTHLLRHIRPDLAQISMPAALAIDLAILVLEERYGWRH